MSHLSRRGKTTRWRGVLYEVFRTLLILAAMLAAAALVYYVEVRFKPQSYFPPGM